MASFASSATLGGARKHALTNFAILVELVGLGKISNICNFLT